MFKKIVCVFLSLIILAAVFTGCGKKEDSNVKKGDAKAFTHVLRFEDDGIEFCVPEEHSGNTFSDLGVNCMVTYDFFTYSTASYHEYDKEAPVEKKTVGNYTFDYQKFNYLGAKDWIIYVIRISFTESKNEMEHRYYKIVYNVYGENYDDAQVEAFMKTIKFLEW